MKILSKIKKYIPQHKKKVLLYEYKDKYGNFDYTLYKQIQEAGNKRKIASSWVTKEEIVFLSDYIKKKINPSTGICHGTRRGLEQMWFSENLSNIPVIGTDISETATDFPNTIQWDFHETNPDWAQKFDFVYSNSFDHSYNPGKALTSWMKTLKPQGICIIEHSQYHEPSAVNQLDPFGADLDIMPFLVLEWSKGAYSVREVITSPHPKGEYGFPKWLIIKNND